MPNNKISLNVHEELTPRAILSEIIRYMQYENVKDEQGYETKKQELMEELISRKRLKADPLDKAKVKLKKVLFGQKSASNIRQDKDPANAYFLAYANLTNNIEKFKDILLIIDQKKQGLDFKIGSFLSDGVNEKKEILDVFEDKYASKYRNKYHDSDPKQKRISPK